MRRPKVEGRTTSQRSPASAISITETPWAAWDFLTLSADQLAVASRKSSPWSTYSWFITRSPRDELAEP